MGRKLYSAVPPRLLYKSQLKKYKSYSPIITHWLRLSLLSYRFSVRNSELFFAISFMLFFHPPQLSLNLHHSYSSLQCFVYLFNYILYRLSFIMSISSFITKKNLRHGKNRSHGEHGKGFITKNKVN